MMQLTQARLRETQKHRRGDSCSSSESGADDDAEIGEVPHVTSHRRPSVENAEALTHNLWLDDLSELGDPGPSLPTTAHAPRFLKGLSAPKAASLVRVATAAQLRALSRLERREFAARRADLAFRERLRAGLAFSALGHAWELLVQVLTLVGCALYITDSYKLRRGGYGAEALLFCVFSADLAANFLAAKNRVAFWLRPIVALEVATLVPLLLELSAWGRRSVASDLFDLAHLLRVVRLLRVIHRLPLSPVDLKLLETVLLDMVVIFVSAGLFQLMESEGVNFGDSLYFVIVTISTVGYGDISPATTLGRSFLSALIVSAIICVPLQVNNLVDLLRLQSQYARASFRGRGREHVLLVGHAHLANMFRAFLKEFFHPDRLGAAATAPTVVIMCPTEPSAALSRLALDPAFSGQVTLLRGSVQSNFDLRRADAQNAKACFVLADYETHEALREDEQNTMRALLVENYSPSIDTFVQLCATQNRPALEAADADYIFCFDAFRMGCLATTALFPGFAPMLHNLLRSSHVGGVLDSALFQRVREADMAYAKNLREAALLQTERAQPEEQLQSYVEGTDFELRLVDMDDAWRGRSYRDFALRVYQELEGGVFVLGLQRLLLHPRSLEVLHRETLVSPMFRSTGRHDDMGDEAEDVLFNFDLALSPDTTPKVQCKALVMAMDAHDAERVKSVKPDSVWAAAASPRRSVVKDVILDVDSPRVSVSEHNAVLSPRSCAGRLLHKNARLQFSDHLVVVLRRLGRDMSAFLSAVRRHYLAASEFHFPIVLLVEELADAEHLQRSAAAQVLRFPDVYVCHGHARSNTSMRLACVHSARAICIMRLDDDSSLAMSGEDSNRAEESIDRQAVFAFTFILSYLLDYVGRRRYGKVLKIPQFRFCVESASAATLRVLNRVYFKTFVQRVRRWQTIDADERASLMEAAECEGDKASLVDKIHEYVASATDQSQGRISFSINPAALLPFFTSGQGVSLDFFNSLTCQTLLNEALPEFVLKLMAVEDVEQKKHSAEVSRVFDTRAADNVLIQLGLPINDRERAWGDLTKILLSKFFTMPFALYRRVPPTEKEASKAPAAAYVITGPPKRCAVYPEDLIFCLAPKTHVLRLLALFPPVKRSAPNLSRPTSLPPPPVGDPSAFL
eukprot:scaffold301_cov243-Pinguiococcus_pyrenoidosus.AAC.75